jgi:RNA polymerase sigma factor (TIGR02999 family)
MAEKPGDVTEMLIAYGAGDRTVLDSLLPLVYDELRRIAASYLKAERADHTLQPTALVHEAYLRLINQRRADWRNRAQFLGLAAQMMRRILVNHATALRAEKRGSGGEKVSLDEVDAFFVAQNLDVLALDEALSQFAQIDEEKSRIVEMKFFGGLTAEEIAEISGKSTRERDLTIARGWLYQKLTETK